MELKMEFKTITGGPLSFIHFFFKGALLGKKAALFLSYVDARQNLQKPLPSV